MAKGRRMARIPNIEPHEATREKYLRHWPSGALWREPERFPMLTGEALFGRPQPLVLEVGCGTGEFLVGEAQARPDELFLGIEASRRAAYFAIDLARQADLQNVLVLRADVKMLYPLMTPESLSSVHVLFPDPNYGTKYEKKRVFDAAFLDAMHRALLPDGIIQLVTDEQEFFTDVLAVAETDARFERTHRERYLATFEPRVKTRFQRAWERKDKPVFRLELSRKT